MKNKGVFFLKEERLVALEKENVRKYTPFLRYERGLWHAFNGIEDQWKEDE